MVNGTLAVPVAKTAAPEEPNMALVEASKLIGILEHSAQSDYATHDYREQDHGNEKEDNHPRHLSCIGVSGRPLYKMNDSRSKTSPIESLRRDKGF